MCYAVFDLALQQGYTSDGWSYRIYWDSGDGYLKVEFVNEKKEIWVLEHLHIANIEVSITNIEDARDATARIGYRLEHDGSWVIRGFKDNKPIASPFGFPRLVFDKATPVIARSFSGYQKVEREVTPEGIVRPLKPPTPVSKAMRIVPSRKEAFGLGSGGRRRLRILFESTLSGVGIKPTRAGIIRAEEVIYELDAKFKFIPSEEATEKAILELLDFIQKDFYFKS
jgi:hypothetical protein